MKIQRIAVGFFSKGKQTYHEVSNVDDILAIDWVAKIVRLSRHIGLYYDAADINSYAPDKLIHLCYQGGDMVANEIGLIIGDGQDLGLKHYRREMDKEILKNLRENSERNK